MHTRLSQHHWMPTVLLTVVVSTAGCGDRDTASIASPDVPVEPSMSASTAGSYLFVAGADGLPDGLERVIARAGGRLDYHLEGIGVAVATSDDPAFVARAGQLGGMHGAIPNPDIQMLPRPEHVEHLTAEMFSDPPTSGDDDFFFDLQWGHDAVDVPEAWNAGARGAGVRVAVLDSGIDDDHPDLAPNLNLALSRSFRSGEAVDDPPVDGFFHHGTHVAGLVAAADNGLGTIGVAPEAEIVALKILSNSNQGGFVGNFGDLIAAIMYAADNGADVINMSLGAAVSRRGEIVDAEGDVIPVPASAINQLLVALGRATEYAHRRGVTLVASAGNQARDGDRDRDLVHLPSDLPHVLSIASTGPLGWGLNPGANLDVPSFFTNHGTSVISFAAPGGNRDFGLPEDQFCSVTGVTAPCFVFDFVMSTNFSSFGAWAWSLGTSMSAPYAAGVAALVISENGGSMHPEQVEAAMRRSADDLGRPGHDAFFGAGRLNAGKAVR